MPTLRINFPGGRYHATPYGHHVNEGQIEWPPSPWRLLRALISCGFTTQHWSEIPTDGRALFEKLASHPPSYRLPSASATHSRHYMPLGSLDNGRERTTLVFDTWADVGDGVLEVLWDCELNADERELLGRLADCLAYLGRSESWVEARLIEDGATTDNSFTSYPHRAGTRPGLDWEQVALTSAIGPEDYKQWRTEKTESALAEFPLPTGKAKPPKALATARAKAVDAYPLDLLDCLTKDTAWWKQRRWSQPPGSQRIIYWRRSDALQVGTPKQSRRAAVKSLTSMLLALTTPSGNSSALPSVARTLPQAELLHRAIVGRAAKGNRIVCPELTGRDAHGEPLLGAHQHAHILPLDLDNDGHLDHVLVHASMGLGEMAQRAIRTLRRTWMKGGVGELQVAVAGVGDVNSLRQMQGKIGASISHLLGPLEGATVWISQTPFVPPRYVKKSGKNSLHGQVNAELASRGLPSAKQVDVLKDESIALRHFIRVRRRGGQPPPIDIGYAVRVEFDQPLISDSLPLALGYGSHFGLGLFHALS